MSALATILAATEAAETSKTAFYVAGGLLAVFAVLVSALGIARPDFPRGAAAQRLTMLVAVVLIAGAMSTAVITA